MEYYLAIAQLMTGAKMQRKNVSSGTQWELVLGYSRVVRLGDSVYVSGTTATDKEDNIVGVANPYAQTI
ncbi:MAG TPA: hypothetical protein VI278_13075 [Nitrososphaeraceae archaeon]|jgi:enamine deaminase RidA (YjgF/YER057c/UK114 family)